MQRYDNVHKINDRKCVFMIINSVVSGGGSDSDKPLLDPYYIEYGSSGDKYGYFIPYLKITPTSASTSLNSSFSKTYITGFRDDTVSSDFSELPGLTGTVIALDAGTTSSVSYSHKDNALLKVSNKMGGAIYEPDEEVFDGIDARYYLAEDRWSNTSTYYRSIKHPPSNFKTRITSNTSSMSNASAPGVHDLVAKIGLPQYDGDYVIEGYFAYGSSLNPYSSEKYKEKIVVDGSTFEVKFTTIALEALFYIANGTSHRVLISKISKIAPQTYIEGDTYNAKVRLSSGTVYNTWIAFYKGSSDSGELFKKYTYPMTYKTTNIPFSGFPAGQYHAVLYNSSDVKTHEVTFTVSTADASVVFS